jgi:hypothetical protein
VRVPLIATLAWGSDDGGEEEEKDKDKEEEEEEAGAAGRSGDARLGEEDKGEERSAGPCDELRGTSRGDRNGVSGVEVAEAAASSRSAWTTSWGSRQEAAAAAAAVAAVVAAVAAAADTPRKALHRPA